LQHKTTYKVVNPLNMVWPWSGGVSTRIFWQFLLSVEVERAFSTAGIFATGDRLKPCPHWRL